MNGLIAVSFLFLIASSCSPKDDGAAVSAGGASTTVGSGGFTGGIGGSSSVASGGLDFGGNTVEPIPPRECKPSAAKPTFRLTGTICGKAVEYSAPEGTRILISHAPFVSDVNVFTVADTEFATTPNTLSRDFLKTHDVQFHVNTNESMAFAVGESTLTVHGGKIHICGIGTAFFKEETQMKAAIESIEPESNARGRIRVRLSNLRVDAADSEFGATEVPVCSTEGELTAVFEGIYERVI
ncbi:MAG TPA: hypothetical protein VFQ61_25150 [Polyangiaceae bacterium]|nr:hypothetical protein [Polyangiaceae bacterium]